MANLNTAERPMSFTDDSQRNTSFDSSKLTQSEFTQFTQNSKNTLRGFDRKFSIRKAAYAYRDNLEQSYNMT